MRRSAGRHDFPEGRPVSCMRRVVGIPSAVTLATFAIVAAKLP